MFMLPIETQFSGNPKKYTYLACSNDALPDVKVGDRVVVISKLKEDGTPSLSIATVTKVDPLANLDGLMPIVDIISRDNLKHATAIYTQAAPKAVV